MFKLSLSFLHSVVSVSPFEISFAAEIDLCDSIFEFDFDLEEFVISLAIAFPKFFVLFEEFALVGLGDNIELVETAELSVVFFEVVLEVEALALEDPDFLHQMVEMSAGGALFLPIGDIDLIFAFVVGVNLYILVHAEGVAALQML